MFTVKRHTPLWQRDQNGFTFLEVMTALAILAIALTGVYRLQSQTISMNAAARFYTTAPLLAQSKMSTLATTPVAELIDDSGDFGDAFPGFTWQLNTEEIVPEPFEDTNLAFKKLEIVVRLNEGEYNYHIQTYRHWQK